MGLGSQRFGEQVMRVEPRIGLIVVGFDSVSVWPAFFRSLEESSVKPDIVIVVENSPSVPKIPQPIYSGAVTILHRPDNPGYGAAINWGARDLPLEIDFIVACNPDVVFAPDTLSTLLMELGREDSAGIAGPRIMNSDGSLYPSARAFPGIRVGIGHALLGEIWKKNPWTKRYLGHYQGTSPRLVDWLSGACLMLSREAFDSVDGFDEQYFMFVEDVDLCFRLKKSGWRSLYVPAAEIVHSGAHATGPIMKDMVKVHHASVEIFLARLYAGAHYWPLRQLLKVGLWLRSLIAPLQHQYRRPRP